MTSIAAPKSLRAKEFGDFQTPSQLAEQTAKAIKNVGFAPRSVFEPTCGRGSFIRAALSQFTSTERILGVEIDPAMLHDASVSLNGTDFNTQVDLVIGDIFELDWDAAFAGLPDPLLILGNPPWVTNSGMGLINGRNLPKKSNIRLDKGIDAMTGRGNFDVSEWILLEALKRFKGRDAMLAMLCKSSVARRLLQYAWQHDFPISRCSIHEFDAQRSFGVSVNACLFMAQSGTAASEKICSVFDSIDSPFPSRTVGFTHGDGLVSDISHYESLRFLRTSEPHRRWRSGIKHDCAKLMELTLTDGQYRNGRGERVEIEDSHVYRLYKGSDVANLSRSADPKYVIVTQRNIAEDPSEMREYAPATWRYLDSNRFEFDSRGSAVYDGRPAFSMFGIGDYTFTDWKVAVSSFHKRIEFVAIPPCDGKPSMVDDTVYYLPCMNRGQAEFLVSILNSPMAINFLSSMAFSDEKRPVTARLLNRLNVSELIRALGLVAEARDCGFEREFFGQQFELTAR